MFHLRVVESYFSPLMERIGKTITEHERQKTTNVYNHNNK